MCVVLVYCRTLFSCNYDPTYAEAHTSVAELYAGVCRELKHILYMIAL